MGGEWDGACDADKTERRDGLPVLNPSMPPEMGLYSGTLPEYAPWALFGTNGATLHPPL